MKKILAAVVVMAGTQADAQDAMMMVNDLIGIANFSCYQGLEQACHQANEIDYAASEMMRANQDCQFYSIPEACAYAQYSYSQLIQTHQATVGQFTRALNPYLQQYTHMNGQIPADPFSGLSPGDMAMALHNPTVIQFDNVGPNGETVTFEGLSIAQQHLQTSITNAQSFADIIGGD